MPSQDEKQVVSNCSKHNWLSLGVSSCRRDKIQQDKTLQRVKGWRMTRMVGQDRWHWNLSINAWTFLMGSRYKEIYSMFLP